LLLFPPDGKKNSRVTVLFGHRSSKFDSTFKREIRIYMGARGKKRLALAANELETVPRVEIA